MSLEKAGPILTGVIQFMLVGHAVHNFVGLG